MNYLTLYYMGIGKWSVYRLTSIGRSLQACWSSHCGGAQSRSTGCPRSWVSRLMLPEVSTLIVRSTPSGSSQTRLCCSFCTWRWWHRPIFPNTVYSCSSQNQWLSPIQNVNQGNNYRITFYIKHCITNYY